MLTLFITQAISINRTSRTLFYETTEPGDVTASSVKECLSVEVPNLPLKDLAEALIKSGEKFWKNEPEILLQSEIQLVIKVTVAEYVLLKDISGTIKEYFEENRNLPGSRGGVW